MTKTEIIEELTRKSGLRKREVTYIVDNFLDRILESVFEGNKVEIRGFGSFFPVEKKERTVYSPIAKKKIQVPQKQGLGFRPSKAIERTIKGA